MKHFRETSAGFHRVKVPKPALKRQPIAPRVALVVIVHQPYVKFLADCLPVWAAQAGDCGLFVVADGCQGLSVGDEWSVIRGTFGYPAKSRNAALEALADNYDWIFFWDADDIPPRDAVNRIARALASANELDAVFAPGFPAGADLREKWALSSNGLWRVSAMKFAGGWPETWLEDWHLGSRLLRFGFRIRPLPGGTMTRRRHLEQRSRQDAGIRLWSARRVGIITLLRGGWNREARREMFYRWLDAVKDLETPNQTGLTVLIEGGDFNSSQFIHDELSPLFQRVTILEAEPPEKWQKLPRGEDEHGSGLQAVHARIGRNYARALEATPEELVLTWEDDVFPKMPGALKRISGLLNPSEGIAAVGAAYPSRYNSKIAVCSRDANRWVNSPKLEDVTEPLDVGMIGAGFTLWNRAALEKVPPLGASPSLARLGWDGYLGQRMKAAGYRLILAPEFCDHLTSAG